MFVQTTPYRRSRGMRGMAATQDQLATINALYQQELGRTADSGGLSYWANFIDSGYSFTDIAKGIANSPEYQSVHSATPPVAPPPTPPVSVPVMTPPVVQQPVYPSPLTPALTTALTQPTSSLMPASATGGDNTRTLLIAGIAIGAIFLLKKKKKKHP